MGLPNRDTMLRWLDEAYAQNPGPWTEHSQGVARAAEAIAQGCGMDAERAYAMGLMHDIGRYEGVRGVHHVIAGYEFMMQKGYPDIARICLSHSFPCMRLEECFGKLDVTSEELDFLTHFLGEAQLDDYDRLIQFCDAIAWGKGVCLMEKRIVNVALRYGTTPHMIDKWKQFFAIKEMFESRLGHSVYKLFDEVYENTFDN